MELTLSIPALLFPAIFGLSLIFLMVSLVLSFWEVRLSTKALEIQLKDMGNLD